MTNNVLRIVANLETPKPAETAAFYSDIFGLEIAMDHGWIVTVAAEPREHRPQLSAMSEGGSGTPVPVLSIEVADLDAVLKQARAAGAEIAYGPADEPWGVRRFFLRDPDGRLINVLTHR